MAQSEAISGQGTIFKRLTAAIGEINGINGPGKSRSTIEVTRLEDTDGYQQFIGGLRNPGTVTLNMNYTELGYKTMNDDFESDDVVAYSIELPDGSKFTFNGLVTELPLTINQGDKMTMDVTIQISGKVTIVPSVP